MDMVVIQNTLPFLKKSLKNSLLEKMTVILKEKGFLIMDDKRKLPNELEEFFLEEKRGKVSFFKLKKSGDAQRYLKSSADSINVHMNEQKKEIKNLHVKISKSLEESKKQREENLKEEDLRKENESLKKKLKLTQVSLSSAVRDFKKVYEDLGIKRLQVEEDNKEMSIMQNKLKSFNKSLEERVDQRTEELNESNKKLKKSSEKIEKNQKERTFFFSSLSHELRTPLNAILGFSHILKKELKNLGPNDKDYLDSIYTSGLSLLRLVNSVHDFTKIELNALKVVKKKFHFKNMLETLSLFYQKQSLQKGLKYTLEIDEKIPSWINCDELALKQVLDNLLSNALKFTRKGSLKLQVNQRKRDDDQMKVDLLIQVMDTGMGMDKDSLNELFKPFSQVHQLDSQFEERGSGLGLFISQTIIHDLDGSIGVTSQEGRGSSFIIEIPEVIFFEEEDFRDEKRFQFLGDTIIIADDESINLKLYKAFLSGHNLNVITVDDGLELIEEAKKENPKLIITDFNMPLLRGDKVLDILRAEKIEVPVILISALKGSSLPTSSFDGFLHKPVDEDLFLKEIARFLKHKVQDLEKKEKEEENTFPNFTLPKDLTKEEHQFLQNLHKRLKVWKNEMNITDILEKTSPLIEEVKGTRLEVLTPFFLKLLDLAEIFNIEEITKLLDDGVDEISFED